MGVKYIFELRFDSHRVLNLDSELGTEHGTRHAPLFSKKYLITEISF